MPSTWVSAVSFILLTSLSSASTPEHLRGVAKSKAHQYVASAEGTWQCLDGSKVISFDQINDDYCDCADGSDEPGTSACPNGQFHCMNRGHIPAYIPSSHVNDGICDTACCDGTDEYDGQITCPNTCKELGAAARKAADEDARISMRGWKTRQTYIDSAKRKKTELEAERGRLDTQIVVAEQTEKELKITLDRAEARESRLSKQGEGIADRAREKITEYKSAITALRDEIAEINGRVELLAGILEDLKNDHNQNYHDMAVKAAVKAWEELKGSVPPESAVTVEQLDLLENETLDLGDDTVDFQEQHDFDETVSLLYRLQDYFPAQIRQFWTEKVAYLRSILVEHGFLKPETPSDGKVSRSLQKARDVHSQAVTETSRLRTQIDDVAKQLSTGYGPDDVFLAIKGDCVSLNTGEYTYEVCIMGHVTQKSNKDNQSTNIGKFAWFENDSKVMVYHKGLRCWNGPERSARVELECGIENEVMKVTEPSKCQYIIKMRTPAVCVKPQKTKISEKEEL